jgi:tetratricopeptide (TPR) repeat protein
MKSLLLIICIVVIAVGIGLFATRDRPILPPSNEPKAAASQRADPHPGFLSVEAKTAGVTQVALEEQTSAPSAITPSRNHRDTPVSAAVFAQAIETLVSAEATFQQKQAVWGQLRDAGKLDVAITELEERVSKNPGTAEYPAVLGQAYLQKAGSIQDVREQGILGMKADQSFEAALNSDAQNWAARFWKTTAMSYWPPQLGKGKEVIENCVELLKQQEVRPPRPEFAQVYVLLGDMYQREGYADYARQTWERGLALFPNHEVLSAKKSEAAN